MNLIVFDLEWNIGYQPKTFLYHGAELTLRGEIIQIGAVRINARGDVLDTFEVNLRPRIFRKLQHHIAKVPACPKGIWTRVCRCGRACRNSLTGPGRTPSWPSGALMMCRC